jgi:hypothetical protein
VYEVVQSCSHFKVTYSVTPGNFAFVDSLRSLWRVLTLLTNATLIWRESQQNWRSIMRMLMHVHLPLEPFNTAVRDGSAGQKIKRILDAAKPEAVYFCEHNGQRGGTLVVNLDDPSGIPALAEPWFLTFNANVEFRVAMTPEDLGRSNLEALGKQWA